jgi:hypothetical protein
MAELYAAGLGDEWQIAVLGRRCDHGGGPVQMLQSLPSWHCCFLINFVPVPKLVTHISTIRSSQPYMQLLMVTLRFQVWQHLHYLHACSINFFTRAH